MNGDGEVRAGLEVADRRFADSSDGVAGQAAKLRQVREQLLERRAQLVLRLAAGGGIGELGFGSGS